MKKLLLSMALLAGFTAAATETTLEVKDATDFQGTYVEETPASEGNNGQAARYQPLNSLKINGYSFTFDKGTSKTDPAYYYSMSTNPNGAKTIRIYNGNTMTIAAPEGVTFKSIEFTGSNGTADGTVTASVGEAAMPSKTSMTWSNDDAVSSVTFTMGSNFRISSMVVSTDATVVPPTPTEVTFEKATTLESGVYALVVMQDGASKLVRPYIGTQSYGRWNVTDITLDGNKLTTTEDNAFLFTVADGKVTVQDNTAEVRYYGMDNSHFTSFQFYAQVNEGCYYTYEFVGDNLKLTNVLNPTCIVCQSKGTQGTWYSNLAPANAPAEYNLPILFKKASGSGVEAVEAENDANAPVVYYNLQGQRVDNPEQGLYIRVQGKKATKVVL